LIRHLRHNEINTLKWDDRIRQSVNGLPYAYSWWLNAVCPEWEALVSDDYLALMPLTRGRKYGIEYLYQPYFTQQLGIFSLDDITPQVVSEFIHAIPQRYRYIEIQLNAANQPRNLNFTRKVRNNFTIDLSSTYVTLSDAYHRNCKRNIQKAINSGLTIKGGPDPADFVQFISRYMFKEYNPVKNDLYPLLQKICSISISNKYGEIAGVYDSHHNLLSSGWFITTEKHCLFLVCASTPEGKANGAMYYLVDHAIREKAGRELTFDFTGSDLPGVANFNKGFGALKSTYLAIKRNNLPGLIKWLKK
jgi:hypothetical protein